MVSVGYRKRPAALWHWSSWGASMLWAGPGRTLARDADALREVGYLAEERAAILEHDAGMTRDEATALAWEAVMAEPGLLDGLDGRKGKSRGPTEHWLPPRPDWDALAT